MIQRILQAKSKKVAANGRYSPQQSEISLRIFTQIVVGVVRDGGIFSVLIDHIRKNITRVISPKGKNR